MIVEIKIVVTFWYLHFKKMINKIQYTHINEILTPIIFTPRGGPLRAQREHSNCAPRVRLLCDPCAPNLRIILEALLMFQINQIGRDHHVLSKKSPAHPLFNLINILKIFASFGIPTKGYKIKRRVRGWFFW